MSVVTRTPSGPLKDGDTSSKSSSVRIVAQPTEVAHYRLGKEIGRGGFGVVFEALDTRNGQTTAVKRISLSGVPAGELTSLRSEIQLLQQLVHPNIVRYIDSITTRNFLFIVLEWVEAGSLAQVVKKFGALSEGLASLYVAQTLAGLAFLHEQGVVHRDIKGGNLLMDKQGTVKLTDFGVAALAEHARPRAAEAGSKAGAGAAAVGRDASPEVAGSPYWMAPEVIELSGAVPASDIWSLGATVIELVTGRPPYFDLSPLSAMFHIVQDEAPPISDTVSPVLRDFLGRCLRKQPELRATAGELLMHPWVRSALAGAAAASQPQPAVSSGLMGKSTTTSRPAGSGQPAWQAGLDSSIMGVGQGSGLRASGGPSTSTSGRMPPSGAEIRYWQPADQPQNVIQPSQYGQHSVQSAPLASPRGR